MQRPANTLDPVLSTASSLPDLDFDKLLQMCGDLGRYQFMLLVLFGFLNFFASIHYFTQTIASFVPDHWCYHEKLENKSFDEIKQIYSRFKEPSCTKLDEIYDIDNVTRSNERCDRWIYNHDFGFRSMNTELNWVCHNAYKSSVGQSFFFVGSVTGTLIFGFLSDRLGRLPILIASNFCAFLGDFLTTYSDKSWTFSIFRFISGLSADTDVYLMQMIVIEYIKPNWRTLGLNLMIGIFYCSGLASLPWIAVLAKDWKTFLRATSFPLLFILTYYFFIQESALWLLTRNNLEGAIRRMRVVAKINRRQVDERDFDHFRKHFAEQREKGTERKETVVDMFRYPRMRIITFILFYESIVITMSYDTVSRNMEGIGISALVTFSVTATMILPASLLLCCFQNRIGRKGMALISMLMAGIVTTLTGLILIFETSQNPILIVSFIFVGRFFCSVSYDSGQQYAAEIIPTCVRGQGVAVVHVVGFATSFLVPYIVLLGKHFRASPSLILGALNLTGAVMYLFLPETAKKVLPKCVEDFETFGKDEGLCSFVCCKKNSLKAEN